MRCPDCMKFVSLEMADPEDEGMEIDGTTLTGTVRIHRDCADCSQELKEFSFDVDVELEHPESGGACPSMLDEEDEGYLAPELELAGVDLQPEERTQTTTAAGKPIKNYRYMKTFFGYSATADMRCSHCGAEWEQQFSDDVQASGMDEMV